MGDGSQVNAAGTIYTSGAFAAGNSGTFTVTVPEAGSYTYGLSSKAYINMQFVQASGTSATITVQGTLAASIGLASYDAGSTTYQYNPIPEPGACGLAAAAPAGLFWVVRRARRSRQGC